MLMRLSNRLWYLLKIDQRIQHWDDARYLKLLYRLRTAEKLDLSNPQTFGQKLQWLKINDRQTVYTTMVDKFEVKRWVADRIGESYVVPNLGVWESFEEIDFDLLPEQFVLKCTHDSGGLAICEDRGTFDFQAAQIKIEKSLSRNYYYSGREWPYRNVRPRIIAEVYLPAWLPGDVSSGTEPIVLATKHERNPSDPSMNPDGIIDYKFYCFHGEPKFLYVSQGLHDHGSARMDFLDLDWIPAEFVRPDYLRFDEIPPKPASFDAMLALARELSSDVPFLRVDLFEHHGRVLFSEATFSPVSGMMLVNPASANLEIGRLLDLSVVKPSF